MCSRHRNAPLRSPCKKEASAQLCGGWLMDPSNCTSPSVHHSFCIEVLLFLGKPTANDGVIQGPRYFPPKWDCFNRPSLFAVGLRRTPSVLCHCLRVYWGIASMKGASWASPQCLPPGKYNWRTLFPRTKEQTQINLGPDLRWQRYKNSSCKQMMMTILWVW